MMIRITECLDSHATPKRSADEERTVRRIAGRAVLAAVMVLWPCVYPVAAQSYEPEPATVPAPPLNVAMAGNVLVTPSSIITVQAVGMPWQGGLPAYRLDRVVVTLVAPSAVQWSSPLTDAVAFGPIWEGTLVEVSYVDRDRAYLLNCATGAYAWVDLAILHQADAPTAPATCEAYRARQLDVVSTDGQPEAVVEAPFVLAPRSSRGASLVRGYLVKAARVAQVSCSPPGLSGICSRVIRRKPWAFPS